MQVYMAGIEGQSKNLGRLPDNYIDFALSSYFYLGERKNVLDLLYKKCNHILIDSGAHSFQHGKKVDLNTFIDKYISFIRRNTDNPKIEGFFEMDIDNVVGYEKVLEYRKQLEEVSNKIIPVWHTNRGINDFIEMCKKYSGKRISIGGFSGDIIDGQYNLFINLAHKYNCKVHILGMTRMPLLNTLNMGRDDSVDSSRWLQAGVYGAVDLPSHICGKIEFNGLQGLRSISSNTFNKINFCTGIIIQKGLKEVDRKLEIK